MSPDPSVQKSIEVDLALIDLTMRLASIRYTTLTDIGEAGSGACNGRGPATRWDSVDRG